MGGHQKIQSKSCRKYCHLPTVELTQRSLNKHRLSPQTIKDLFVSRVLQSAVVKRLYSLIIHNGLIEIEFLLLL